MAVNNAEKLEILKGKLSMYNTTLTPQVYMHLQAHLCVYFIYIG